MLYIYFDTHVAIVLYHLAFNIVSGISFHIHELSSQGVKSLIFLYPSPVKLIPSPPAVSTSVPFARKAPAEQNVSLVSFNVRNVLFVREYWVDQPVLPSGRTASGFR